MNTAIKKTLSCLIVSLALSHSMAALAGDISRKAEEKITSDVTAMTEVMKLTPQQAESIKELKTTLFIKNKEASKAHEKGSSELKQARKANMKEYQNAFAEAVSKKQMKAFKKYRSEQKAKKKA
ncbi:hypothetical protein [Endozoicomonas elysicola]|uniref:Zinc resistance-associated protein n=1 Tax=Endozoicomonas elysicola TaxID=305900 RepID=A0A081KBH7_9GAMM|nr:hypothetical protein [Endozoicomonas elysicola]KEI71503.1 hypothetical protein GV64_12790 [Endozoicomonas elysicola]